jgi:proline dehydrogenase
VLGQWATEKLLRHSVFAHFVAGESAADIAPTLQELHRLGVGGILDYAAEADMDAAESTIADHVNQPSRVYPYEGEDVCEANARTFLSAVRAVHDTTPEGFAAVKVTALGDPALLERVSHAINALKAFFHTLDASGTGSITRGDFVAAWGREFDVSAAESHAMFDRLDANSDGGVDLLEFTNELSLEEIAPLVRSCREAGPLFSSALNEAECDALGVMLGRLDEIAALASELGVRLMIDAEHTHFQPAIDHAVLQLQRAHNREYPAIFGTYQAYLRDCAGKLDLDLERSRREGWHFGAKLVRGAYMVHERRRARELGVDDPIHPDVEATHTSYNDAIDALLRRCPCPERTSVMVATHNQASTERAAGLLLSGESRVDRERVFFGQLLGMADHLTFNLAGNGLKAYKYVPYGPVREVIPYLLRRAHENSDALSGAALQRNMMLAEARRRICGF